MNKQQQVPNTIESDKLMAMGNYQQQEPCDSFDTLSTTVMIILGVTCLFKVALSNIELRSYSWVKWIPESGLLVLFGVFIGGSIRITQHLFDWEKRNVLLSLDNHFLYVRMR